MSKAKPYEESFRGEKEKKRTEWFIKAPEWEPFLFVFLLYNIYEGNDTFCN